MSQQNAIYISLGSNQGDRLKHLQQAVDFIFKRIGNIQLIAKLYNTPALGFDGPNFLNTCLVVRSDMSAQTAMEKTRFRTHQTYSTPSLMPRKTTFSGSTNYIHNFTVTSNEIFLIYRRVFSQLH